MLSTSCYSMAPNLSSTQIIMSTFILIPLIFPIYESSSVNFLNDTQAYTEVNINLL
jgi:hypothetical protein